MGIKRGDVFYDVEANHICFVVSDPDKDPKHVIVTNFTSDGPTKDQTCSVKAAEHVSLKSASVVAYNYSYAIDRAVIEDRLKTGMAKSRAPLSPALLQRITDGFHKTKAASFGCKYYLRAQGLIP